MCTYDSDMSCAEDNDQELQELRRRVAAHEQATVDRSEEMRFRLLYAALAGALLALSGGPWLYSHEHRDYEITASLFRLFALSNPGPSVVIPEDYSPMINVVPVALIVLCVVCFAACAHPTNSTSAHGMLAVVAGLAAVAFAVFGITTGGDESAGSAAWLALVISVAIGAVAGRRALSLKRADVPRRNAR